MEITQIFEEAQLAVDLPAWQKCIRRLYGHDHCCWTSDEERDNGQRDDSSKHLEKAEQVN